jgi:hypothetical protein
METGVPLKYSKGQDPRDVGKLHITDLGPEHAGRFDIIDGLAYNSYYKVRVLCPPRNTC